MAANVRTVRVPAKLEPGMPFGPVLEKFGGAFIGVARQPVDGLVLVGLFSQSGHPLYVWPYQLEDAKSVIREMTNGLIDAEGGL
jgi:hypothetical protein